MTSELTLGTVTLGYRQSGSGPAFSEDVQTPPARVREVADLARDGHFHLLQGLGHGSAFGHRPDVVSTCLRSIVDRYG